MKTGYHAVYENNLYEAIDKASENNFEFVQFDLGVPKFFLDGLTEAELVKIRNYASDKNIEITFHAPGDNVSLFCDYPLIRKGILEQYEMILYKANILEARHITIHTGHYPEFKKAGMVEDEFSIENQRYYEDILYSNVTKIINSSGHVLICAENSDLDRLKINALRRVIEKNNNLFLTLDIPKLLTKAFEINQEVYDFMFEHKHLIRELHIHDVNKRFGKHQIVSEGIINFSDFRELFFKDGIYMNFEVRPFEAAKLSRERLISMQLKA